MDKQDTEIKKDFIKTVFDHNQGLIELADNKANIIIGINSILIPLLFGVTGLNFIDLLNNNLLVNAFILNTFFIISLILLGVSFGFAIFVIKARLSEEYENQIFFKTIVKQTRESYHKKIMEMTEEEIIQNYLTEIYALAKINEEKYKNYRKSLWTLISGVITLVIGFIIIAIVNYSLI